MAAEDYSSLDEPRRRLEREAALVRQAGERVVRHWSEAADLRAAFPSGPAAMVDGLWAFWTQGRNRLEADEEALETLRSRNAEISATLAPEVRRRASWERLLRLVLLGAFNRLTFTEEELRWLGEAGTAEE